MPRQREGRDHLRVELMTRLANDLGERPFGGPDGLVGAGVDQRVEGRGALVGRPSR